jgi:chromate transporter
VTDEPSQQRVPGQHGVTRGEATKVWAYVGFNSFGGPAGQIAVMHRELVERRRWVSEGRFLHALNYCMILPGPEAQQLATYIGWLMHGVPGGVIAGALFVVPGFVAMLALAISYVLFGSVTWVAGLLYGVQAAVVAIVAEAVIRIGRRTLRSRALQATAGVSFVAIFCFAVPFPLIIGAAGLFGWLCGRLRPFWFPMAARRGAESQAEFSALLPDDERVDRATASSTMRAAGVCAVLWLVPLAALVVVLGSANVFAQEGVLFSKSAVITFGGAYAVLGYITQQAVNRYAWISGAGPPAPVGARGILGVLTFHT